MPRRSIGILSRCAVILTLAALAGCAPNSGVDESATGTDGRLSVLLTDTAPPRMRAAVVTISRIYLQSDAGEVVLRDQPVTTNLLTLANDVAPLVDGAVVPAGSYRALRMVLSGAYVQVDDGDGTTSLYASSPDYEGLPQGAHVDGALQMPSLGTSGLKVELPSDALTIETSQKVVLVDFDVAQSFGHGAGGGAKWVLHPVVKATDAKASGSLVVTARPSSVAVMPLGSDGRPVTLADFSAVLVTSPEGAERLPLSDPDGDGVYEARFLYLLPGSYQVDLEGPQGTATNTTPAHPAQITIPSGQQVSEGFVVDSVQPLAPEEQAAP